MGAIRPDVLPIKGSYTYTSWGTICNNLGSTDRFYAHDGVVVAGVEFYWPNDAYLYENLGLRASCSWSCSCCAWVLTQPVVDVPLGLHVVLLSVVVCDLNLPRCDALYIYFHRYHILVGGSQQPSSFWKSLLVVMTKYRIRIRIRCSKQINYGEAVCNIS